MHFALINWITAFLPSHANLLGRLPVPLPLPFYLFVTPFFSYLFFLWKFIFLSFVTRLIWCLFSFFTPSILSFQYYSFCFTYYRYSLLFLLCSLFTLSSRIMYNNFEIHHCVFIYYLLVYCINLERSYSSRNPSSPADLILQPCGPWPVPRLSEIAHREHILSSKLIDQRRWSDPYTFSEIYFHMSLSPPLIIFALQDILMYKVLYMYILSYPLIFNCYIYVITYIFT